MRTADFDYHLPGERIAQEPAEPRDSARLLVLDRQSGAISHLVFRQLGDLLRPNDLLVLNQTRVIPARLFAKKVPSGGRVEILLLEQKEECIWETIVGGRKIVPGLHLDLEGGVDGKIIEDLGSARRLIQFSRPIETVLDRHGHMPLPPYIHAKIEDTERYQTVYSQDPGSAAAPTAGLHFTEDLIQYLKSIGIKFAIVTLHIGLDTFAPVTEEFPVDHEIHSEWCQVPLEVVNAVENVRRKGGRVIAVGTTSVRALETAALRGGMRGVIQEFEGKTDLFIIPGYKFRVVDGLITNFHLPRSTLLMLVSAFAGREQILTTYEVAKEENYRFYSFGDAMLIF